MNAGSCITCPAAAPAATFHRFISAAGCGCCCLLPLHVGGHPRRDCLEQFVDVLSLVLDGSYLQRQQATIKDEREHINKLLEAITPGVATYVRLHPASDLGSFEISQRKLTVSSSSANKKASIEVNKVFGPGTSQEDVAKELHPKLLSAIRQNEQASLPSATATTPHQHLYSCNYHTKR